MINDFIEVVEVVGCWMATMHGYGTGGCFYC